MQQPRKRNELFACLTPSPAPRLYPCFSKAEDTHGHNCAVAVQLKALGCRWVED